MRGTVVLKDGTGPHISNPARRIIGMHYVREEKLPFVGSSYEFVGAEQGDTGVSVFLFYGKPGSGPGPHRHPYDEIQFHS